MASSTIDLWCATWLESACETLGTLAGKKFSGSLAESPAGEAEPGGEWAEFDCGGDLSGRWAVRVAEEPAFATLLLGAPPAAPEETKEAVLELFRQISGRFESAFSSALKRKLTITFRGSEVAWQSAAGQMLQMSDGVQTLRVQLAVSKELEESMAAPLAEEIAPSAQAQSNVVLQSTGEPNLELLLDVGLEVSLRFGQQRMSLRQILELAPGAVIELDQQVNEPVELLLGEKVFARGDVVVVDGNYGLRVTEISSPGQRVEQLGN